MRTLLARIVALVAAAAIDTVAESAPACRGTLSGDVKAKFECSVVFGTLAGGDHAFVISIPAPLEGVASLVPGAFQLPGPPAARTYTLAELGVGKASVAAEGGLLYTAAKTSSQRGEVTLTVTSLRRSTKLPGGVDAHGRYRARLLPAGGGRTGEVVVDVQF